jgi:hypothetical protein
MKPSLLTILLFFSCAQGVDSFGIKGLLFAIHPRRIIDGFNTAIVGKNKYENITFRQDFRIENDNKVYNSKLDFFSTLAQLGRSKKELWDEHLASYYNEFLTVAEKQGVEVYDKSLKRMYSMRFVDTFSGDNTSNYTALCIRTNFQFQENSTTKKESIYRMEILKSKYKLFQSKFSDDYETSGVASYNYLWKRIVYHELMHCLLHLGHLPQEDKYRDDIMYPSYSIHIPLTKREWNKMLKRNFSKSIIEQMEYIK